jgi:hypothetical protein
MKKIHILILYHVLEFKLIIENNTDQHPCGQHSFGEEQ